MRNVFDVGINEKSTIKGSNFSIGILKLPTLYVLFQYLTAYVLFTVNLRVRNTHCRLLKLICNV